MLPRAVIRVGLLATFDSPNHSTLPLHDVRFFLLRQSNLEKKTARQKCMENRLRLGQFVTQRQGASFVENWVDGFAFNDLNKSVSVY